MSSTLLALPRRRLSTPYSFLTAYGADLLLDLDFSNTGSLWSDTGMTTPAANGVAVAAVTDGSTYGLHAIQSTAGARPTRDDTAINGVCGLDLAGAHGLIVPDPIGGETQFEVWFVGDVASGTQIIYETYFGTFNGFAQIYTNAAHGFEASVWAAGPLSSYQSLSKSAGAHVVHQIVDTTLASLCSKIYVDDDNTGFVQVNNDNMGSAAMTGGQDLYFGRRYDGSLGVVGKAGRLVIVRGIRSAPERAASFAALQTQFGTPLQTGLNHMRSGTQLSDHVSPPRRTEIFVAAATTSTAWIDLLADVTPVGGSAIADYLDARYVTIQADGANLYYALSDDATTALDSTANASPGPSTCALLVNGQSVRVLLETPANERRYLAFKTAASTGQIRVWASSPKV